MPTQSTLGADDLGQALYDELSETITVPAVDLTDAEFNVDLNDPSNDVIVSSLTIEELTTTEVGGTGAFDKLMKANRNHIEEEYNAGRLTGAQFAEAYMALTTAALGSAVQFLLGKDQAYWTSVMAKNQAKQAQIEAITARVNLETAKANLAMVSVQAQTAAGELALVKMQLANADMDYAIKSEQREAARAQFKDLLTDGTSVGGIIGRQNDLADEEIENKRAMTLDTRRDGTGVSGMIKLQKEMIKEQAEAKRAETLDTRSDNAAVKGTIGKQKDLYSQQITSYQQDAKYKVGKVFSDAWVAQKTIIDDLDPPTNFTVTNINTVLTGLKNSVDI